MNAVDSSVVIAGCATWHEAHEVARGALDAHPQLIAHCALETFATLTRLPSPHRIPGALVAAFLHEQFADEPLTLPPSKMRDLVSEVHRLGLAGGAVYDGFIALTAAEHGAWLLSLDRRAEDTYRRCGVRYRLLS
ncbi:MAG: type II toxin-antitoxin system VapC family toxin [Chloroflexota bacterium]